MPHPESEAPDSSGPPPGEAAPEETRITDPPAALRSRNPLAWFRFFGPGAIVASVTVGSGEIVFPSRGGALFGYQLLWIYRLWSSYLDSLPALRRRVNHRLLRAAAYGWTLLPALIILWTLRRLQQTGAVEPGFELRGKTLRRGQRIWAMQGAANRDPQQFPQPDRFDILRRNNRHVAFGYGVHHCLGAPLARIEGQIAFQALLRLPELTLENRVPEWQEGVSLRTPKALPVRFRGS